jgi:hypothetical protein
MSLPLLLVILHGDDPRMDLLYFWAAVLLALTPMIIFGGIGVWLARKIWREWREDKVRNAEFGMRN